MYTVADTGFSSGGGQNGREAPEIFFVPPLSSSGGGQGGEGGGQNSRRRGKILHYPEILHHLSNEFTRIYRQFPPPVSALVYVP